MFRQIVKIKWFIMLASMLILTGCGGSSDSPADGSAGGSGSIISGVSSKGPINGGVVTVYAVNADGTLGASLGTGTTEADGSYSIDVGTYSGAILVQVDGGTYTDEATGTQKSNGVLRAALASATQNVTMSITPLTEIAVQEAGSLTAANINSANTLVSNMVGGIDILSTLPADVIDVSSASASLEAQNYGIVLGAISQMVADGACVDVAACISSIVSDLSDNTLDTTGNDLSTAITNFVNSAKNATGLTESEIGVDDAVSGATSNSVNTTTGLTSASLNGEYTWVSRDTLFFDGEPNSGLHTAYVNEVALVFDGVGGFTYSVSGNNYNKQTSYDDILNTLNVAVTTSPDSESGSGTYFVSDSGLLTTSLGFSAKVSADGTTLVSGSWDNTSANRYETNTGFGIKRGAGHSAATLNGEYTWVSRDTLFFDGVTNSGLHTAYVNELSIVFDGVGGFTYSVNGNNYNKQTSYDDILNTLNVAVTTSPDSESSSGTYSVSDSGVLTTSLGFSAKVSADGTTLVSGSWDNTSANRYETNTGFGIKRGAGHSAATLNGEYTWVSRDTLFFDGEPNSGLHTAYVNEVALVFDGVGGFTYSVNGNNYNNQTSYDDILNTLNITVTTTPDSESDSGTYSVSDSGVLTTSIGFGAKISADGTTLVSGSWDNPSANRYETNIGYGIKR